jgi:glycosyl transferase family 10 (putative fucosyltransferase)
VPESTEMAGRRPLILFYRTRRGYTARHVPEGELDGCEFTSDAARWPEADAVLFDAAALGRKASVPKYPGQRWVAWSLESAVHYPWLTDPAFLRHFEITMTYHRESTVWAPYVDQSVVSALLAPPRPKRPDTPAVYLQSNPMDRSGRMPYVKELMKRVKVASFGHVMNNQGDAHIGAGQEAKLALIGQYRFTLAFENAIEPDYVTEKLYDALIAGSVPVYLGAPNVREFAPAEHCYIDASRFAGPAELAAYLNRLVEDERAYGEYLAWKTSGLSPSFRALAAQVERPALERLCTHLRTTIDASRRPGGRPTYPIRSPWYRRLARRLLPSSVIRRHDRPSVGEARETGRERRR